MGLILQGRILVGLVLSDSRYTSVRVTSSFIPCLHLLIYVEEAKSVMLGLNLFLLQVLNLKLLGSLPDRKVRFKLQMPKWLLFASTVWSDLISAVLVASCLFVVLVTPDLKLCLHLLQLEEHFCREGE